jgi:ribosome assembly protein YihI (activator of Der GTPase)
VAATGVHYRQGLSGQQKRRVRPELQIKARVKKKMKKKTTID